MKLVNIGEPRKVDLPDSEECEAHDFVYLSPEVMTGKLYKARSDMYSLGLLCWELWHQDKIFKAERKLKLKEFIQKQMKDPLEINMPESENPFTQLICGCTTGDNRYTSTVFVNEVKKIQIGCEDEEVI